MKKLLTNSLFLFALLLFGCGSTPNNIAISVNQGQCLIGGTDGAIASNPSTAPYCMSVTVQNNNSGQNANNVQVTSGGFTLSYTALTSTGIQQYSSAICDYTASDGVCPSGTNQIGNITIYDPNNCATQQGSKVSTLMAGGGACTLYLQIASESYTIGSYPINLTYNYTNSNANYSINTMVYQHVDLYAGGTTGAYVLNDVSFESALLKNTSNVNVMVHDNYGNLYFNSGESVYVYNGSRTKPLGKKLPNTINSLTIDNNSNVIAGTSAGVYYYNLNNSSSSWNPLQDTNNKLALSSNILGLVYAGNTSNIFYITESANAYACIESVKSELTMSCNLITRSSLQSYTKALFAYNGVLYAGVGTSFESYLSTTSWSAYPVTPIITAPAYISSVQVNSYGALFGVNNPSPYNESSIYFCIDSVVGCLAESSGKGSYVTGNINGTTMDGAGYIYGIGSNINSTDFNGVINAYGFFESQTSTTTIWQPISGAESLATLITVSSLVIVNK